MSIQMQARSSTTGALVSWVAASYDFAAAGYPGPGLPLDVSVADNPQLNVLLGAQGLPGSLATIGRLTTAHSPLALWHFDGDVLDASGNARTLTVAGGTAVYSELWPGFRGLSFQSLSLTRTDAAMRIAGDMTVEAVLMLDATPTADALFGVTGPDETEAANIQWEWDVLANRQPVWFSESGAGVNASYGPAAAVLPPIGVPFHLASTRISNVIRWYCNGVLMGAASSALATPTGGTVATLQVGKVNSFFHPNFLMADLKIIGSGLTAAQVLAEAELTIGALY